MSTSPYQDSMRRRGREVAFLPAHDPVIDALEPSLRRAVGETWRRRAHEELKAAMAFSMLVQELLVTGAPPDTVTRFSRGVHDEVRHAEVCRALAARYLGEDVPWPPSVPVPTGGGAPYFPGAGAHDGHARVCAALHTVTLGCVNETIAAVFIESSLDAATSPSARATLGVILADEVEHGRAGWVHLASTKGDLEIAAAVQREMATMVHNVARCWFDDACITLPDGVPEHGLPGNDDTHRSVVTALRELVLPGFAELGFDTAAAREVVDRFAAQVPGTMVGDP